MIALSHSVTLSVMANLVIPEMADLVIPEMADLVIPEMAEVKPKASDAVPVVVNTGPLTLDKIRASKECKLNRGHE